LRVDGYKPDDVEFQMIYGFMFIWLNFTSIDYSSRKIQMKNESMPIIVKPFIINKKINHRQQKVKVF